MYSRITIIVLSFLLPLGNALAADLPAGLQSALSRILPGASPDEVAPSPIDGLYRVTAGQDVIYLSADGRYALWGDLVDVENGRNLTEMRRRQARRDALETLGEESMIVFAPEAVRHTVTVFTDVDCGYCARLHRQMPDYHALGVAVRYVAFPRAGLTSPSYEKTVSVWCSDDPHRAIGDAKFGRHVPPRHCENPVKDHYATGVSFGVRGTPTIVLESGDMLGGYLPPEELARYLSRAADES